MSKRVRVMAGMAGTVALTGGALTGVAATATPAMAAPRTATGCTDDTLGLNCMIIEGQGTYVSSVKESQSNLAPPLGNICDYTAKWRGDESAAAHLGWRTWYGKTKHNCAHFEAWIGFSHIGHNFKNNTGFYGYWKSSGTAHQWTHPVKETIHKF